MRAIRGAAALLILLVVVAVALPADAEDGDPDATVTADLEHGRVSIAREDEKSVVLVMLGDLPADGLLALNLWTGDCDDLGSRIDVDLPPIRVGDIGVVYAEVPAIDDYGATLTVHELPDNHGNIPSRYGPADATTRATGDVGDVVDCGPLFPDVDLQGSDLRAAASSARLRQYQRFARADLVAGGKVVGRVDIHGDGFLTVDVTGMAPGVHGLQLRASGDCSAPGAKLEDVDLPDVIVNADGTGTLIALAGPSDIDALIAGNGTSATVRARPDNHANIPNRYGGPDATTVATGDAGASVGCAPLHAVGLAERYVDSVYQDVLGRIADPAAVRTWSGAYDRGGAPAVAGGVLGATEARRKMVEQMYRSTLFREPDAAGLAYWTRYLGKPGSSLSTLQAQLYASGAFFWLMGGSNQTLVTTLNGPNPLWVAYLDLGGSRFTFTKAVMASERRRTLDIQVVYDTYQYRSGATDGDIAYWLEYLRGGGDVRAIRAHLMISSIWYIDALAAGGYRHRSWINLIWKLIPSVVS